MSITTPSIEHFEAVAQDAIPPTLISEVLVPNTWGGNQPRIIRHVDGTIRLLYLYTDGLTTCWRLMRRDLLGSWMVEASGPTTDDAYLLIDKNTDHAHVVAWPSGVPTTYTSPDFSGIAVTGNFPVLPFGNRHYGNAGIGADGILCIKMSHEFVGTTAASALVSDAHDTTMYACGAFIGAPMNCWVWLPTIAHYKGLRYTYDYLFVNPKGMPKGVYATSTSNLYYQVTNVPNLDTSAHFQMLFNGTQLYVTSITTDKSWTQIDTNTPMPAPANATASPQLLLQESFVDSQGRIYSCYYSEDPTNSSVRGNYVTITNSAGVNLFNGKWPGMPSYGFYRIFEDAKNRLWLLYSAQGSQSTLVYLYQITITVVSASAVTLTLGPFKDLSAPFSPYSLEAPIYIAVPRGGNDRSLNIDMIFCATWATYQSGVNFNVGTAYAGGNQRVFYASVRLPD